MASITMAVPRSPPAMSSITMVPKTTITGIIRCFHPVRNLSLSAYTCAPQTTIASVASSAGWNWNGPRASQFWLPLTRTPSEV